MCKTYNCRFCFTNLFKHLLLLLLLPFVHAGLLSLWRGDRLLPGSVLPGCRAAAAREYHALISPHSSAPRPATIRLCQTVPETVCFRRYHRYQSNVAGMPPAIQLSVSEVGFKDVNKKLKLPGAEWHPAVFLFFVKWINQNKIDCVLKGRGSKHAIAAAVLPSCGQILILTSQLEEKNQSFNFVKALWQQLCCRLI